jgi:glycosyltransferase involved in cell wall biosynthesis
MVEDYERRYGARGTLLLPSRAPAAAAAARAAGRSPAAGVALTYAFAGTINSPGYARLLRLLADSLDRRGGQLLIFGPLTPAQAEAEGLVRSNVRLCGLVSPEDLLGRLRDEADVLFVPMSFAPEDAPNMRMAFPSKLTDYTAVGLPLLICGPPYCSAVRWAQANAGVADVVITDDVDALGGAVDRLSRDPAYRASLANTSQQVGNRDFSAAAAESIFHSALHGATQ